MVLPVPKIMLEMIALGFEHVVIFIFRFPTTPACGNNQGNGFIVEGMVGDKSIVVEHFAIALAGEGKFTPIDE